MRSVPTFLAFLIILIAGQAGNAQSARWTTDMPLIDCDGTPHVRESGKKSELLVPVRFKDGKTQILQEFLW